jgi:hypothetical protein
MIDLTIASLYVLRCILAKIGVLSPYFSAQISLGSNASGLFNLILNHLKHNKISFAHFTGSSFGCHVWTNNHMIKDCSRVSFPVILDMVPYVFLTKIGTLIDWLLMFLTRQSREGLRS